MTGGGDTRVDEAVRARLAEGPLDVLDLLAGLRRDLPGLLAKQEGAIHAWLRRAVRDERLQLAGRSARGLARYALAGAAVDAASEEPARETGTIAPEISRRALMVVRGVRDQADRGRIMVEVAAHLEHLAKGDAAARFGPVRQARTLLQRADRGRGTLAFVDGFGDRAKRFLRHEGPWVLGAVLAFLVLRQFVVEVYVIPTGSMRTSLEVGDRVVVVKHGDPSRWRIFVFEDRANDKAVVKRIAALGGEEVAVFQGDVYIDGALAVKPPDVREALRRRGPRWTAQEGTLVDWDRRMAHGEATWSPRNWPTAGDHWFDTNPPVQRTGPIALHDAYLDVTFDRPEAGRLAVALGRGFLDTPGYEDAVQWTVAIQEAPGGGRDLVVEERRSGATGFETLLRESATATGKITVGLAYVDGRLRVHVDGRTVFEDARQAPYHPLQASLATAEGTQIVEVALDRDVHYSHDGDLAVPGPAETGRAMRPYRVPDGHVFFLGDNTRNSEDSRFETVGAVPHERLVGPVVYRILPPGRFGGVR